MASADAQLHRTALVVDRDFRPDGVLFRPGTVREVKALSLSAVRSSFPAGGDRQLTRAMLLVYSDLSSRRAAFNAVLYAGPMTTPVPKSEVLMSCLANGARAHARFDRDVAAVRSAAAALPAFVPGRPSSRAAAEIGVRLAWTDMLNNGGLGCGGHVSGELVPIVWRSTTEPGFGHSDGTIQSVPFRATYRPGSGWQVLFRAN